MTADAPALWNTLKHWFTEHPRVVVALSGGVDSSLVACTARRCLNAGSVIAVISAGASLKARDLEQARALARQFDFPLVEIETSEMRDPRYLSNPINRCYFCKTALYGALDRILAERFPGYDILNGSNVDDLGDYRPGLQAAAEHRVYSPLADCGLHKHEIRQLAKDLGLPNWNKPASPCLSSRFPYGESITQERLAQVEAAEEVLAGLGFGDVRVRYIQNTARVEVPAADVEALRRQWPTVCAAMVRLAFDGAELDEEGLVSGKLNRVLDQNALSLKVRTTTAAK